MIGFFLLFGTKTSVREVRPLDRPCPACREHGHLHLRASRRYFTLFFIPVVPLGAAQNFWACEYCSAQFAAPEP